MVWMDEFSDLKAARRRVETAFHAQIGMMSPLWVAFGAAASAGAAFWLMSRWSKPVNIEAATSSIDAAFVEIATRAPGHDAAPLDDAPLSDAAATPVEEPSIETVVEALVEVEFAIADDLTKLAGVGPKIARALADRGVERFDQLAAWTQEDLAAFDAALDLRGRAIRASFVDQARRLAAGEA